jgi:FhaA, N-terminal domain/FHA domain
LSVLRAIEQKIEALVEGVFGRAFKTNVQPVELARKLVKEMDDHRTVSVSRVYVPNEYTVFLSPHDRRQFQAYEDSLKLELQEYLAEHARREGYVMLSPPAVVITTDDELGLGVFGIATRMVQRGRRGASDPPVPKQAGATMVYEPKGEPAGFDAAAVADVAPEAVALTIDGERHEVDKRVVVLGRAQDCDIQLADPNVSRRHAELRQEETSYWIVDLGSTNGLEVNGRRLRQAKLEDGDRITLGSTELVFERELP